jgi:hypothetical protein
MLLDLVEHRGNAPALELVADSSLEEELWIRKAVARGIPVLVLRGGSPTHPQEAPDL